MSPQTPAHAEPPEDLDDADYGSVGYPAPSYAYGGGDGAAPKNTQSDTQAEPPALDGAEVALTPRRYE